MSSDLVQVRYTKWNGALHWHFDMTRLGEDEYGIWLGAPAGTELRRGDSDVIKVSPAFAALMPSGLWTAVFWTAVFNEVTPDSPFGYDVYIDVCTPPVWDGDTVTAIDLDLDVVRTFAGEVRLEDEDEFVEHAASMEYPDHIVAAARAAAAAMVTAVEANEEPFDEVGRAWLEMARASSE
ncbi:MAG TPA: DUF402 domain-containing protein [Acidimicrobiia bacterium]|nr:DUF402 domain-containing protein [Acidimicrobiia bacterium]